MDDSRFKFPKSHRLRKQSEFDRVYQGQAFAVDDVLVVKAVANDLLQTRLGLSVSRKVGNAVVRNQWKRYIREAFRLQQHELPTSLDLVFRPRKGAKCDQAAIYRSVFKLVRRVARKVK